MLLSMLLQGFITAVIFILISSTISAIKAFMFARKWNQYMKERGGYYEAESGVTVTKKSMH
ncbi:hypothetical protein UFOVP1437_7 [uncultured Caudovirales phage]|uniref:Uncharacterized protein n=1 Tax=uncultured Caudovirales phage TaxID=2100421 RepID=A0A6J7XBB9_9CAUD|nr:hypothetical protein UFOVP1437_7 [uncultured Caudovirales phage]CAB5228163.1 hypothetical protein UFOVP1531_57 [uncultured Caudovirales phage]